jgi:hypothetical protein
MNTSHISRRIAVLVVAAALAAVLSAPAQADPPPHGLSSGYELEYFSPGTGGADSASVPVRPDDRADRAIAPAAQPTGIRPDDRAFRGLGRVTDSAPVRPDDRADRRLPIVSVLPEPVSSTGFDWVDAGIGAVAAFGLALLIAVASIAGLRHRRAAALS